MIYYDYLIQLLNEKSYVVDELRAEKFDFAFIDCEPFESKLAEEIGVPFMQQNFYFPEFALIYHNGNNS